MASHGLGYVGDESGAGGEDDFELGHGVDTAGQHHELDLADDPVWCEFVVRRTNTLLHDIGVNAQPFPSFDELRSHASSMFVAIFETVFDTRIPGIVRAPEIVPDYIRNAQLVIDAVARTIPGCEGILDSVTAEGVYNGDARQVQELLDVLHNYWYREGHLYQRESQLPPADEHDMRGSEAGEQPASPVLEGQPQQSPQQALSAYSYPGEHEEDLDSGIGQSELYRSTPPSPPASPLPRGGEQLASPGSAATDPDMYPVSAVGPSIRAVPCIVFCSRVVFAG